MQTTETLAALPPVTDRSEIRVKAIVGSQTTTPKVWTLRRPVTIIGARRHAHIVLHDADVSRSHAAIVNTGRSILLADLCSESGTYCNGQRVKLRVVRSGDIIRVGPIDIELQLERRVIPSPQEYVNGDPLRMPRLFDLVRLDTGRRIPIRAAVAVVGTRQGADIQLEAGEIALVHSVLFACGNDVGIYDAGSSTPLKLNGEPTAIGLIHHRDRISCGPFELMVQMEGEATGSSASSGLDSKARGGPTRPAAASAAPGETMHPAASLPASGSPAGGRAAKLRDADAATEPMSWTIANGRNGGGTPGPVHHAEHAPAPADEDAIYDPAEELAGYEESQEPAEYELSGPQEALGASPPQIAPAIDGLEARIASIQSDISRSWAQLADCQQSLDYRAKDLEDKERTLAQLADELNGRAAELADREKDTAHRQSGLERRSSELERRSSELGRRESELAARCIEMKTLSKELEERQAQTQRLSEESESRSRELEALGRRLAEERRELDHHQQTADAGRRELEAREKELSEQAAILEERTAKLERHTEALLINEKKVLEDRKQLDQHEARLRVYEQKLRARRGELAARENSIASRVAAVDQFAQFLQQANQAYQGIAASKGPERHATRDAASGPAPDPADAGVLPEVPERSAPPNGDPYPVDYAKIRRAAVESLEDHARQMMEDLAG